MIYTIGKAWQVSGIVFLPSGAECVCCTLSDSSLGRLKVQSLCASYLDHITKSRSRG